MKKNLESGHEWTSYSDLFMGLAFIFLLLYVVTHLYSGSGGYQSQQEMQRLALENEDLKNQLRVYESAKSKTISQSSQEEQKLYEELLGKLDLLQDEARQEKERLQAQAKDNAQKEKALNKYQQLVRNLINANVVSKSKIQNRDEIIEDQEGEIVQQKRQITNLEGEIANKKSEIQENQNKIENLNKDLQKRIQALQKARKLKKLTAKKYQQEVQKIKSQTQKTVQSLESQSKAYAQELQKASQQLNTLQSEIQSKERQLATTQAQAESLKSQLQNAESEFSKRQASLRAQYEADKKAERALFEAEIQKQKLSAKQRAQKEAEYRKVLAQREAQYQGELQELSGQLAKLKAEQAARKNIAKQIREGLSRAGVKAEVDPNTGDVYIDFGENYFDAGSASLKPEMVDILKKVMPVYSGSLFGDPKISEKIKQVEIVGFASPTYQNRVIDPKSLDPKDKKAIEYNLDLSYSRARSIFQYAFDSQKMNYSHQKQMRSLVKVSGKSFFDAEKVNRDIASTMDAKTFCQKFDCKKSQRVLIKFEVDQNK